MLPILHSYRFQSNEELFKIPILPSKIFCVLNCAPFATDVGQPLQFRYAQSLCLLRRQTAIFFATLKIVHFALLRSLNRLHTARAPHPVS